MNKNINLAFENEDSLKKGINSDNSNPRADKNKLTGVYATVAQAFKRQEHPQLKKASSLECLSRNNDNNNYENTTLSTVIRVEELNDWVKQASASRVMESQYKVSIYVVFFL